MNTPGALCSMPAVYRPMELPDVFKARRRPQRLHHVDGRALVGAVLHDRGARANPCTIGGEFDAFRPWCVTMKRSTVPSGLFGHISSISLFHSRSPKSAARNRPSVTTLPTD